MWSVAHWFPKTETILELIQFAVIKKHSELSAKCLQQIVWYETHWSY